MNSENANNVEADSKQENLASMQEAENNENAVSNEAMITETANRNVDSKRLGVEEFDKSDNAFSGPSDIILMATESSEVTSNNEFQYRTGVNFANSDISWRTATNITDIGDIALELNRNMNVEYLMPMNILQNIDNTIQETVMYDDNSLFDSIQAMTSQDVNAYLNTDLDHGTPNHNLNLDDVQNQDDTNDASTVGNAVNDISELGNSQASQNFNNENADELASVFAQYYAENGSPLSDEEQSELLNNIDDNAEFNIYEDAELINNTNDNTAFEIDDNDETLNNINDNSNAENAEDSEFFNDVDNNGVPEIGEEVELFINNNNERTLPNFGGDAAQLGVQLNNQLSDQLLNNFRVSEIFEVERHVDALNSDNNPSTSTNLFEIYKIERKSNEEKAGGSATENRPDVNHIIIEERDVTADGSTIGDVYHIHRIPNTLNEQQEREILQQVYGNIDDPNQIDGVGTGSFLEIVTQSADSGTQPSDNQFIEESVSSESPNESSYSLVTISEHRYTTGTNISLCSEGGQMCNELIREIMYDPKSNITPAAVNSGAGTQKLKLVINHTIEKIMLSEPEASSDSGIQELMPDLVPENDNITDSDPEASGNVGNQEVMPVLEPQTDDNPAGKPEAQPEDSGDAGNQESNPALEDGIDKINTTEAEAQPATSADAGKQESKPVLEGGIDKITTNEPEAEPKAEPETEAELEVKAEASDDAGKQESNSVLEHGIDESTTSEAEAQPEASDDAGKQESNSVLEHGIDESTTSEAEAQPEASDDAGKQESNSVLEHGIDESTTSEAEAQPEASDDAGKQESNSVLEHGIYKITTTEAEAQPATSVDAGKQESKPVLEGGIDKITTTEAEAQPVTSADAGKQESKPVLKRSIDKVSAEEAEEDATDESNESKAKNKRTE